MVNVIPPSTGPRRRARLSACLLALATLVACGSRERSGVAPTEPDAPPPPRVVIVSVDGLRPDAIGPATTPNIVALMQRGAYTLSARTSDGVAGSAVQHIQSRFDLVFVHLPDTDLSGHSSGWMSSDYVAHVAEADAAIGRIRAAMGEGDTLLVTADHGGQGRTHGSSSAVDMTIPWVIAGPRVTPGAVSSSIRTMDTAATAAWVLGASLPASAEGRPVVEAFGAAHRSA